MSPPSIRHALLLRCGLGIGVLLCILSIGSYFTVRHGLYTEIDESVRQSAAMLSNQVELEDSRIIFEWQEGIGTNNGLLDRSLFQFWNETNGTTTRSPTLGSRDLPQFCGPDGSPRLIDIHLPVTNRPARAVGMRIYPFVLPEELERMRTRGPWIDPKSLPHLLVVARDASHVNEVLLRLRWILGIGTLITLGVGYLLIHRAIRSSLQPIEELSAQVRETRVRELEPSLQIPGSIPAELSGLAHDFEALIQRLSITRKRERDFIHHAAHELRTPISGLLATLELSLSKPREPSEYLASLQSCKQSAEALNQLVRRLTALSRIWKNDPILPAPVDLGDLIEQSLLRFQNAFLTRQLKLEFLAPASPAIAFADRTLIQLILNNLLDNAASYAPEGSPVQVRLEPLKSQLHLTVSNPIDAFPDDPERLFEPLYRVETSRTDASTHLGIGLTLSRDAARLMNGSLDVSRTPLGHIAFTLILPSV